MKPLRLTLSAFGPFLRPTVVDLSALSSTRFFLIHGPVGSGKTFLLDGICFALYGCSSGGERDGQAMRSLDAAADQETVVSLEFEVGADRFRVERRLDMASGAGTDDATLWRLPAYGEPGQRDVVASSAAGVSTMLGRLLGLSAEQFCQVAILPQGHFRRFLLASAEERREILARMFDGHLYGQFQDLLLAEFAELRAGLEQTWRERDELTQRYRAAGGDPRQALATSREELDAVSTAEQNHQSRSLEWEKELEGAVRYETLERQRDVSRRELEELEQPSSTPAGALSGRLRAALREYERWREATEEIESISKELDEQREEYEKLRRETNFLESEVEQARLREEEKYLLRRSQEKFEEILAEAEGLEQLEIELERLRARQQELGRERAALAQRLKRAQQERKTLQADLHRLDQAKVRLVTLRQELSELERKQHAARQNAHLEESLQQALQRESRLRESVSALAHEIEKVHRLEAQRRSQDRQASLESLSRELIEGEACPLCGATEHPLPYREVKQTLPLDEDFEDRLRGLTERRDHAVGELSATEQRRARLEGRLEGVSAEPEPEVELAELLAGVAQTVQSLEAKLAQRRRFQERLDELESQLNPGRKRLRQMRLMAERLEATLESAEQVRQSRSTRLSGLLGQSLSTWESTQGPQEPPVSWLEDFEREREQVAERLAELEQVRYGTERAELMAETFALGLAEQRASEKRRESLRREVEGLQRGLMERFRLDFAAWDDLSFALTRAARELRLAQGEGSVVEHEIMVAALKRQVEQSQELLTDVPAPAMRAEQIRSALTREREHAELKIARRVALQRELEQQATDVERYDAAVEKIQGMEGKVASLSRLVSNVRGENSGNLTFLDWVLERTFNQVLLAANLKLDLLAPSRFALRLEPGLEVRVLDYQAGVSRLATSLSGGESFMASLALALGLGEVLQTQSQARERLGMLFVDEGFGYLDRDAIDAALLCLENLRGQGRSIGLVSHVPELRERIRSQIVLERDASGHAAVKVFAV